MWSSSGQYTTGTPSNEESVPLAENIPLTGYEPNILDDLHYSETTEIFFQEQSSDTMPSYLLDVELSDETIGRALSSPLFIQEREEPARTEDKLISLLKKVCCQLSSFLCVMQERRHPCTNLVR